MTTPNTPQAYRAALDALLAKHALHWKSLGYGQFACTSCGAIMTEDDGKQVTREPCSEKCPWAMAEAACAAPHVAPEHMLQ